MPYHRPTELIGRKEKAILHIAMADLKLARPEYEAVLWGAAKVTSSRDLTFSGYERVLDRFKELGFKMKGNGRPSPRRAAKKPAGKLSPFIDPNKGGSWISQAKLKKIYAMWEDVARVKTPEAMRRFLKNRFKVDHERFLDDETANAVIEALKRMGDQ